MGFMETEITLQGSMLEREELRKERAPELPLGVSSSLRFNTKLYIFRVKLQDWARTAT